MKEYQYCVLLFFLIFLKSEFVDAQANLTIFIDVAGSTDLTCGNTPENPCSSIIGALNNTLLPPITYVDSIRFFIMSSISENFNLSDFAWSDMLYNSNFMFESFNNGSHIQFNLFSCVWIAEFNGSLVFTNIAMTSDFILQMSHLNSFSALKSTILDSHFSFKPVYLIIQDSNIKTTNFDMSLNYIVETNIQNSNISSSNFIVSKWGMFTISYSNLENVIFPSYSELSSLNIIDSNFIGTPFYSNAVDDINTYGATIAILNSSFVGNLNDSALTLVSYQVQRISIENTQFLNNSIDLSGGAIKITGNSTVIELINATFLYNDASFGGAFYIGEVSYLNMNFNGCNISSNSASHYGGAIYFESYQNSYLERIEDVSINFGDSIFSNNYALFGGCCFFSMGDSSTPNYITGGRFIGNNAAKGGVLYFEGGNGTRISLQDMYFNNNYAVTEGGSLAIINSTAKFYMNGLEFYNSLVPYGLGGGMYVKSNDANMTLDVISFSNCFGINGSAIWISEGNLNDTGEILIYTNTSNQTFFAFEDQVTPLYSCVAKSSCKDCGGLCVSLNYSSAKTLNNTCFSQAKFCNHQYAIGCDFIEGGVATCKCTDDWKGDQCDTAKPLLSNRTIIIVVVVCSAVGLTLVHLFIYWKFRKQNPARMGYSKIQAE